MTQPVSHPTRRKLIGSWAQAQKDPADDGGLYDPVTAVAKSR